MLDSFSKRYHLDKLVYVEEYDEVMDALKREKQLKNWHRDWKIEMIDLANPNWDDLYNTIL